jgi:hypothetical protein
VTGFGVTGFDALGAHYLADTPQAHGLKAIVV